MELIRLFHPREFDKNIKRFRSSCFTNSSDGSGISLVDLLCAQQHPDSTTVCQHIERFYPEVVGSPIAYWLIQSSQLPQKTRIEPEVSDTGDPCHVNLTGLTDKESRKFFKENYKPENISICDNDQPVVCTQEVLERTFVAND